MARGRFTDDYDGLDESEYALLQAYGDGMDRAHSEANGVYDDDIGGEDEYCPEVILSE